MAASPADRIAGRALLCGLMWGLLVKQQTDPDSMFQLLSIQPVVDASGDYTNAIEVTMPSGVYNIVIVNQLVIPEEP